jgi:hypothetical protein
LVRDKNEPEDVQADLGELFFIDGVRLKAINDELNYFPPAFQIQLSEDGNVWQTLHSEDHFFLPRPPGTHGALTPTRARFVKIHINKSAHYKKGVPIENSRCRRQRCCGAMARSRAGIVIYTHGERERTWSSAACQQHCVGSESRCAKRRFEAQERKY